MQAYRIWFVNFQSDLTLTSENKNLVFHGFSEYGDTIDSIRKLYGYKEEKTKGLATKALQFVFNGVTGFSFPVAHYPVHSLNMRQLRHIVDEVVSSLAEFNFQVSTSANLRIVKILFSLCSFFHHSKYNTFLLGHLCDDGRGSCKQKYGTSCRNQVQLFYLIWSNIFSGFYHLYHGPKGK